MSSGTLYTFSGNFRAQKALIAAKYSGANLNVPQDFVFGKTNTEKPFLGKFPQGKVPAFESADGKVLLTESNAIAYYVANEALRGTNPLAAAQVLQWLSWADSEILPASCAWVFPLLGIMPFNDKTVSRAKKDVGTALTYLNNHLLTRTYLVGERITLADISVFCTLIQLYQNVLEPSVRAPYANVNRWFVTLLNQPQFKAVLENSVSLCDVAITLQNAKKNQGKPAKAEAKPAAAPAPAAEEDDEAPAEEPSGFVMDNFKRVYSNEDESKSIPYFFEHFDPSQYSVWFGEYKYNNELSKVFMSCNLITGMFQRLDKMRKNAFASCILFGDDNNSSISGVWVWQGQELMFPQSPDWQIDYESYAWTKLDYANPDTKKKIEQYFSWTGTDSAGRKFNQGKIFK